jgi:hypothetical protein
MNKTAASGFSPKTTTNNNNHNLRSSLTNGSNANRESTVTSLKEKAGQMYMEQNPDAVKSTYFYNNTKQNASAQGRGGNGAVGVSVYTDQTHSS